MKPHSDTTHIWELERELLGSGTEGTPGRSITTISASRGFGDDAGWKKLKERNLRSRPEERRESFKFWDPDGFMLH